jgi:hypothetical protein
VVDDDVEAAFLKTRGTAIAVVTIPAPTMADTMMKRIFTILLVSLEQLR